MPNRILRDWTDSEKIDTLSCHAERFFTRLIMKADDFGRFSAHLLILKSSLFPLKISNVRTEDIAKWLKECVDAGLIFVYEVNQKAYLEIKIFDQKLKVRRSKYPPSSEEDRIELSMGYVYIIGTTFENPVKIGFSANPWARLKEVTANHHEVLNLLMTFKAEKKLESMIHNSLKEARVKNEWFQLRSNDVGLFEMFSKSEISPENLLKSLRSNYELLRTTTKPELEVETEVETEVEKNPKRNEGEGATHEKKAVKEIFKPPTLDDFINYFLENHYPQELAIRAWKGYDAANWHDSQGNKIKNWKQKCQHVWFKNNSQQNNHQKNDNKFTAADHKIGRNTKSEIENFLEFGNSLDQMAKAGQVNPEGNTGS